jgi:3-carboxy-cis,cis-muconate cycloisomerase
MADLLRLTLSAAAWTAELLAGLEVDTDRMRANLAAAGELPMAEQIATRLIPSLGRLPALELVAAASRVAASSGHDLTAVLAGEPRFAGPLAAAGVGRDELAAAADPAAGLGAAGAFVTAALTAHDGHEREAAGQHRTAPGQDANDQAAQEQTATTRPADG